MLKKNNTRRIILFAFILLFAVMPMFAADDDFGFNAYTTKIVRWFYAIAAGIIVLSLIIWGAKCAAQHNVSPNDWKALACIIIGGVIILLAPTIVSGIFSGGNMGNFEI